MPSFAFLCSPHLYEFEGLTIEHSRIGPPWWPCKANSDPYVRLPKAVRDKLDRFYEIEDKEQHAAGGGCLELSG
jgi:hypothetical protein